MEISKNRSHMIYTISIIGFIFALHIVIPSYSNSSFISLFADENTLSLIYMAGSALSILGFILAPAILRKFGNYLTTFILICLEIAIFYGLITSASPVVLAILFIIQAATSSLIGYCLDLFLESYTNGHSVGAIRGIYMTSLNLAWVLGPFIGSILISDTGNYRNTFLASLAVLFPLLYLIYRNFKSFNDPHYNHPSLIHLTKSILKNADLSKLFYVNLVLQIFYSWMVVYSPIYLNKFIGFSWKEIGIILVIMLLPFILVEYPLGRMTDNKYGEKTTLAIGFIIMGISTIVLSMFSAQILAVWAILLFVTRIGAAMVEIMIEIYLFKTISAKDSSILSAFRIARPASFFFSSIIMIIGLLLFNHQLMFVVIGLFTLTALIPALTIRDIK